MSVHLSSLQRQYRDHLTSLAVGGPAYLPTVLLMGPAGAGKLTVARATAEDLGMDFVSVRVDGAAQGVAELLFGALSEAQRAETHDAPPGLLGHTSSTFIFLSGLENLDPTLWNSFSSLIATKTYRDLLGRYWRISADAWIVGALKTGGSDFLIGPEHWLCTAFERRAGISPPTLSDDMLAICRSILSEGPAGRELDASLGDFFSSAPSIPDHLHSIRRWVETANAAGKAPVPLTRSELEAAMVEDLRWVLAKMSYRGVDLSITQFSNWANQFPLKLRPIAAHLVRQIADYYFIGQSDFYRILGDLIGRSGIPAGHPVVFCRAEPLGKSSPRVAHAIKNQARWRPSTDIDLSGDPRNWASLRSLGVRHMILADDFVGSGTTLSKLFLQNAPLASLLQANPEASLKILLIAGFEAGLTRIKSSIPTQLSKRVQIISGRLFGPRDQCFELRSRILSSEEQRNNLKQFCQDAAAKHYPGLDVDSRLGFRALGALVVFSDTVPNNSLPILWHDRGTWLPLFPGSGLPGV